MSKNIEENEDLIVDVQEVYSKSEEFIENNKTVIIGVVLGLILVVGGFFGYKKLIIAPMEYEAQTDMFMAEKYFGQDSLQKAINGDGINLGFIDIVDDYSGTKAANLAHYYLGICYRNTGEFDLAIDELKQFSSSDVMISTVALGAIGDSYMELGETSDAISYYEKAITNGDNKLTSPIYLFKAGMAYEETQDYAKAYDKYKTLKADYPDSREAQTIDKYIARAEA
ncbi:MAG: tetratricopeptide repeat protein, partial [Vicingaceae bacterium]